MRRAMRPMLLAAAVAVLFGTGCKEQELEKRCSDQQEIIQSLQGENARLKQEADGLRGELDAAKSAQSTQSAKRDVEGERASLEEKLKGAGVSVGVREGRLAVILPSKVFFMPGKAALSRQGLSALQSVAKVIRSEFSDKVIRVEGHTDSQPIRKSNYPSNLELSNHRAETVWHYLTEKAGLDPRTVYTAGFSQYRPIASNDTKSGQQQNRRVELVVIQE